MFSFQTYTYRLMFLQISPYLLCICFKKLSTPNIFYWKPRKETTKLLICRPQIGMSNIVFYIDESKHCMFCLWLKKMKVHQISWVTHLFKMLLCTSLIITLTLPRPHYAPWSCLSCCTPLKQLYSCFAACAFHSWMFMTKFCNKRGLFYGLVNGFQSVMGILT